MGTKLQIERYIRDYVQIYTNNLVRLNLGPPIQIRHVTEKGSTVLSLFWANVLQCEQNFPRSRFQYVETHDRVNKLNKLQVKVDEEYDITVTIVMKTGALYLAGRHVHEWFAKKFRGILERYENPCGAVSEHVDYLDPGYERIQDMESHLQREEVSAIEDRATQDVSDAPGSDALLEGDALSEECSSLCGGRVSDSPAVYRLLLSLLDKWFAAGQKVYLCSAQLDANRLTDISDSVMRHRGTANLDTFFVSYKCNADHSSCDVKRQALLHYPSAHDKLLLEYKLLGKMKYPAAPFQVCYAAAVSEEDSCAEVLSLGGSLLAQDTVHEGLSWASWATMSQDDFTARFVSPLAESAL